MRSTDGENAEHLGNLEALNASLDFSERRVRVITEEAPVGIFETDAEGRCLYVNRVWTEISGLSLEAARGTGWSIAIHKEDLERVEAEWYASVRECRIFRLDYRFQRADGKITWVSGSSAAIRSESGEVLGYVGCLVDIDARKQTEIDLERAKIAALELARTRTQFLANMSHELRTPMNGVLGMVTLLQDTQLNTEQRDLLDSIDLCGRSLLALVGDILDFSKIDAGKMVLTSEDFHLQRLVDDIKRMNEARAAENSLIIITQIDPKAPTSIIGDEVRLGQVLINLVGNAIKFTPAGGSIVLTVTVVKSSSTDVTFRYAVADTGIGIPREKLGKVFDAFSQADATTTRRFGGTGLGLTISADLVTLMGGVLEVRSVEGLGTCFSFVVTSPIGAVVANEQAMTPTVAAPCPPLKVLVAEDNVVNQKLIRTLLEKDGHSVVIVDNGEGAVTATDAGAFDVILMDVQMPILDGVEATRIIRDREARDGVSPITIVALTAQVMSEDVERCKRGGMNSYMTKPVDRNLLRATLADIASRLER